MSELYRQLLGQARRLARQDRTRPQQANLRRAVSTAYYALFRFLVDRSCRELIGVSSERKAYRDILARAFAHGEMSSVCKSFASGSLPQSIRNRLPATFRIAPELRRIAQTFVSTQEKRHLADYDPGETFARPDVVAVLDRVDEAIQLWASIQTSDEARFFLIYLLVWGRISTRS